MRSRRKVIRVAIWLAMLSAAATAAPPAIHDIAGRVDARYNHLKTLKAVFQESYSGAGLKRNESGQLWLEKPGKMRWNYEQPTPKLFLIDGKNAYFYVPAEHQARRMPAKKLDDFRSPIRYLLGKTKLESEFKNLGLSAEPPKQPGDVVLEGVPKGMEDRVQRVLLEITPASQIAGIRIDELDGSITEFTFRDIEENVPVKADLFHFTPPPGIEIIEGQDIAP